MRMNSDITALWPTVTPSILIPMIFSLVFCVGMLPLLTELGEMLNSSLIQDSGEPVPAWVSRIFQGYFYFYVLGSTLPFALFLFFLSQREAPRSGGGYVPFVSIIIPAFNEQEAILRGLTGALNQDYPAYEVIVLDDGSSDFTPYLIESAAVTFVRMPRNVGKPAALNAGIRAAKGSVLVFSDGDSMLRPSAVRRLVRHFADPRIGAVAGRLVLARQDSMLRRWQAIEYLFGQTIVKAAQTGSGASALVCPGPVCAFRRDVLLGLGGFGHDTLVEDFDATLDVIRAGYRVNYEPQAVAETDSLPSWRALGKQRMRWSRGGLQAARKHLGMFFAPSTGLVGMFWLPYTFLIGFGGVLLEAVGLVTLPILVLASGAPLATLKAGLPFIILMELLAASQYIVTLFIGRQFKPDLILAALLIKPFNFFLGWIRLCALIHELRATKASW